MNLIKRCSNCKSIWVVWNWMNITSKESLNPNQEWLHECGNCAATEVTNGKVTNGVPYWLLRHVGKYFVDDKLYERNLVRDISAEFWGMEDDPLDDDENK